MKKLLKTTGSIGVTELLQASVGMVRNKYLANTIGPEGLGIYSLMSSFFQIIGLIAGGCTITGTTKYISQYSAEEDKERVDSIFTLTILTVIGASVIISGILVLKKEFFISAFLDPKIIDVYFILFAFTLIWTNLKQVLIATLQGYMLIGTIIKLRLVTTFLDLILVICLVYMFGMLGFFVSLMISAIITAGIVCIYTFRTTQVHFTKNFLKGDAVWRILIFACNTLAVSMINVSSQYIQRIMIVRNLGIGALGVFQSGISIMEYVGMFNRGSNFYLLPIMSVDMGQVEKRYKINEYLFFIMVVGIPICCACIMFGNIIIRVLFSDRFMPLSSSLPLFIVATFFNSFSSCFQIVLIGSGYLFVHTFTVCVIHILWVLVPYFLMEKYGIAAFPIGFIIGAFCGTALNLLFFLKRDGLRITGRNLFLFLFGLGAVISSSLSVGLNGAIETGIGQRSLLFAIIVATTSLFLTPDQRNLLCVAIRERVRRFKFF